jgi:hypothetical protein
VAEREIETAERIAVLELQVKLLQLTVESTNTKLDELLTLRSKGVGAFWIASSLFGTGLIGAITLVAQWMRG